MITNELKVGVKIKDKVLKDFKLNTLKTAQLKEINNDDYKKDFPMRWLAKTICILLDSIGGEPCNMLGRDFPETVKGLSLIDVSYVLIAGHVFNLGSDIKGLKINCTCQRQKEIELDLDLQNLLLEEDNEYPTPDVTFLVELPNGVEINLPNMEDLGLKGKVWKFITFRLPTLGDMLKHEKDFSPSSKSVFGEKIMSSCMISVEAEDGMALPANMVKMFGEKIISEMTARDMQAMTREFNKYPTHRIFCETTCGWCDREISTPVEPNFLFIAA